ncbi:hypothetical protein C451_06130 [Halococcus thailandensis JCM 13552]|uniref:Uncharacterized protein n=1 Tax=Halococcus thailandensis JCM 13552 TaxID=1227457 RepID=M0NDG7_9EURY|nr:hypothetical protein C451_06130 [Halococcus thailandensis JCM 13552]
MIRGFGAVETVLVETTVRSSSAIGRQKPFASVAVPVAMMPCDRIDIGDHGSGALSWLERPKVITVVNISLQI